MNTANKLGVLLKLFNHLFIGLLVYLFIGLLAPSPVFAAATTNTLGNRNWADGGDYAVCLKSARTTGQTCASAYGNMMGNASQLKMIEDIIGPVRGLTIAMDETDQDYISQMYGRSAIGGVNQYLAFLITNPPADLALWVRDTGQTLGFIPRQAQAQGIGFSGLTPILSIWRGFRNIAYALVAIMMVVIGFMVMFRKKIDPKTVVTVQNSLPRIVIVLLLITFSYAIVGLMIDLMYLAIGVGIALIEAGIPGGSKVSLFGMTADFINGGFLTLLGSVFAPVINNAGAFIFPHSNLTLGPVPVGIIVDLLSGVSAAGILLTLIISIAYLFGFVRIFFMLLTSYINIILAVFVGPLQILVDALPGNNAFVSWLKNLVLHLIPFPITIFMLILGNALSKTVAGNLWAPPLLPQFGVASGFAITILWLGIILSIPSIVSSIREAIKTKALPVGMGAALGPMVGGGMQALQIAYQLKFLRAAGEGKGMAGTVPLERQMKAQQGK